MTNAKNYQKAIVMLSAEPLDNAYLEEFSPRAKAAPQDLSVAPTWFPREVADAATVEQLHRRWTTTDSLLFTAVAAGVIAGVAYFVGWEIGAFLAACGLFQVVAALAGRK